MVNANALDWGYRNEEIRGAALWGARAILDRRGKKPLLDILWDRQSMVADDAAAKLALQKRLDGTGGGLDAMRKWIAGGGVPDLGRDTVGGIVLPAKHGKIRVHWRSAGGYLYLTVAVAEEE